MRLFVVNSGARSLIEIAMIFKEKQRKKNSGKKFKYHLLWKQRRNKQIEIRFPRNDDINITKVHKLLEIREGNSF